MSLLTIVQDACVRAKQTVPSQVVGSTDPTAKLMLALANQDGKHLAKRHDWQGMTIEKKSRLCREVRGARSAKLEQKRIRKSVWSLC